MMRGERDSLCEGKCKKRRVKIKEEEKKDGTMTMNTEREKDN